MLCRLTWFCYSACMTKGKARFRPRQVGSQPVTVYSGQRGTEDERTNGDTSSMRWILVPWICNRLRIILCNRTSDSLAWMASEHVSYHNPQVRKASNVQGEAESHTFWRKNATKIDTSIVSSISKASELEIKHNAVGSNGLKKSPCLRFSEVTSRVLSLVIIIETSFLNSFESRYYCEPLSQLFWVSLSLQRSLFLTLLSLVISAETLFFSTLLSLVVIVGTSFLNFFESRY